MLKDKAAVVTGSTSGIGLAIARAFAKEGAHIMLNGLGDAAEIEKTRAGIEAEFGVKVLFSGANLMNGEEVTKLITDAAAAFGAVDVLVNNAGIQHVDPIDVFPSDKWEAIIRLNLIASFYAIKAALPGMKQKGWGRIINIASTHGLVASTHKAAYVAAKHGLIGLTKVMGIECADTGVTCNAICPGFVSTPLALAQIETKAKADNISMEQASHLLIGEKQPQVQFTKVEQIAGLAMFLASDTASNMQGTALVSDGGWTAQ